MSLLLTDDILQDVLPIVLLHSLSEQLSEDDDETEDAPWANEPLDDETFEGECEFPSLELLE